MFIHNCADIQAPLREARKSFIWENEQKDAFMKLKNLLKDITELKLFDATKPTIIHTDASNIGIGGTLIQTYDGIEYPIAYFSRTLSGSELNYSTLRKELLAVVETVKKFRPYVYGRGFLVLTDHKPLVGLFRNKMDPDCAAVVMRAITYLSSYDMEIAYRRGEENRDADALSRLPMINAITVENLLEEQKKDFYVQSRDAKINQKGLAVDFRGKVLVPMKCRKEIMEEGHVGPFNVGHHGIQRTFDIIRRNYIWKGMFKDVKNYVASCDVCIQKSKRRATHGIPASLPFGGPWEVVCMDIMGPLPVSDEGFKFIKSFM